MSGQASDRPQSTSTVVPIQGETAPVTLDAVFKAAEPLVDRWAEVENGKHQREMQLQEKELELERRHLEVSAAQAGIVTKGAFGVCGALLLLASLLLLQGRDALGMELLKLMLFFGGGFVAGYGYGSSKKKGS